MGKNVYEKYMVRKINYPKSTSQYKHTYVFHELVWHDNNFQLILLFENSVKKFLSIDLSRFICLKIK